MAKPTLARRAAIESEYRHLVIPMARSVLRSLPVPPFELDDLVQAGSLGLWEATAKFTATKKKTFPFYARLRIRGAMIDSVKGKPYQEALHQQILPFVDVRDLNPTVEQRMIEADEVHAVAAARTAKVIRITSAIADRDKKFQPISGKQKRVIELRFGKRGMTQKVAGERMGMRQQSLQEIEAKTLGIIRHKIAA